MVRSPYPAGVAIPKPEKQPKKRRISLRDSQIRKFKRDGTRVRFNRGNHRFERHKPLKKMARVRRNEMRHYLAMHGPFLSEPGNENCAICIVRREHGENIPLNAATEIHHFRGRRGRLLCWKPGFRPSCFFCRDWPHTHKRKAREWGLLAPAVIYDTFPGDGD